MNIERVNQAIDAHRLSELSKQPDKKHPSKSPETEVVDTAHTSELSKVMAKGVQQFQASMKPRADKLAQFKDIADQPLNLTDKQIDTIFDKMIGEEG